MNSTDCLTLVKLRLETYFCDFQNHEKATSGNAGEVKKTKRRPANSLPLQAQMEVRLRTERLVDIESLQKRSRPYSTRWRYAQTNNENFISILLFSVLFYFCFSATPAPLMTMRRLAKAGRELSLQNSLVQPPLLNSKQENEEVRTSRTLAFYCEIRWGQHLRPRNETLNDFTVRSIVCFNNEIKNG